MLVPVVMVQEAAHDDATVSYLLSQTLLAEQEAKEVEELEAKLGGRFDLWDQFTRLEEEGEEEEEEEEASENLLFTFASSVCSSSTRLSTSLCSSTTSSSSPFLRFSSSSYSWCSSCDAETGTHSAQAPAAVLGGYCCARWCAGRARRRPRRWHVHDWFFWYSSPRAGVPFCSRQAQMLGIMVGMYQKDRHALIVDCGSGMCKVGIAGFFAEKFVLIPGMLFVQFLDKVVDLPVLVQVVGGRQITVEVPQLLSDGVREQIVASCQFIFVVMN